MNACLASHRDEKAPLVACLISCLDNALTNQEKTMSRFDRQQKSRIKAARAVYERYIAVMDDPSRDVGSEMLEAYYATGKGDEFDIPSTIVDAMCDLAFSWGSSDIDVSVIFSEARSGIARSPHAKMLLEFATCLQPEAKGFMKDQTFSDLLRMACDHSEVEITNGDQPDYLNIPNMRR
jgi:hypothetical protein